VNVHTERLRLRRFTAADLELLVELDSDPAVVRYVGNGRPTPRAVIQAETLPAFLAYTVDGLGTFAAHRLDDGAFIGWFGLRAWPEPGVAELGYRLRRAAWGQGYATEGALALVNRGFTELGVRRIVAQTMAVNTASRRVMERVGLRFARTWVQEWDEPIEGAELGEVEYALDRPSF
jgi:RimJ/RimL family protein N-acetyltransferase